MVFVTFRVRFFAVAAYVLAAMLPILAVNVGNELPAVQHAQIMVSAGHTMPMEHAGTSDNDVQMLLCQQHCLLAAATLPAQIRTAENSVVISDIILIADWLVSSLSTPPPGPPPKVAVI